MKDLDLPYFVERTALGKSLPVYTQYKGGGTQASTIVRKIYGDVNVELGFPTY